MKNGDIMYVSKIDKKELAERGLSAVTRIEFNNKSKRVYTQVIFHYDTGEFDYGEVSSLNVNEINAI